MRERKTLRVRIDVRAEQQYYAPKKGVNDLVHMGSWSNKSGLDEMMDFYDDMLWQSIYAASLSPSYLNPVQTRADPFSGVGEFAVSHLVCILEGDQRRIESLFRHIQTLLGGDLLGQIQREAEGIVQLEGVHAAQQLLVCLLQTVDHVEMAAHCAGWRAP